MKGRYFRDISIVRHGGESIVPLPEADKVVIFRSFMKAGLRFPLDKMLVAISEDSSDSESFDVESGNEDAEDRPWRPSHVVFRKSTHSLYCQANGLRCAE